MSKRRLVISKLRWAKALDERPVFIPSPRLTGVKRAGVLYENRVANYMKAIYGDENVLHGQWYQYEDRRGVGYCQSDILILPHGDVKDLIILECKLKSRRVAEVQLRYLYKPIVEHLYPNTNIIMVQVCKFLNPKTKGVIIDELDDIYKQDLATLYLRTFA